MLASVDILLGTQDEINAAVLEDPAQIELTHQQVSDARVGGNVDSAIQTLFDWGVESIVEKCGAEGVRIHERGKSPIKVPGFPVEVRNILGAGDAFAAGFIYGVVHGWTYYDSARLGNACGAIVVTRHGCANFMPTFEEATVLMDTQDAS